jgi:hypothetical protein
MKRFNRVSNNPPVSGLQLAGTAFPAGPTKDQQHNNTGKNHHE